MDNIEILMDFIAIFEITNDMSVQKKEGFEGQKAILIPRKILASQCEDNGIIRNIYITDIGYYPKAKFHCRQRPQGADQHILIYCVDGKGTAKIKSKDYEINAGEFLIIPAHYAHKYTADERTPWTIYWIHFKGIVSDSIVELIQKKLDSHKGFIHYNESRIALFESMYNQLERGYGSDNLTFSNMTLSYFLSSIIFHDKYNNPTTILPEHDIINRGIDFMGQNINQTISLEDVANSVNLSTSHFSSLFKKRTGFTPIEYFNHLKIQKACQFLIFSDLRVKEIAFKLGIKDQYYFSRLFTKLMGMPPNEYRERKTR